MVGLPADGKAPPPSTSTPIKAPPANAPLTPYPTATCPPEGWSVSPSYPIVIYDQALAVLGNQLVSFGGTTNVTETTDRAYKFSPISGWSALPSLPEIRSGAVAASDGSRAYIEGGYNGSGYTNTLWAWNPVLGRYQTLAHAPIATAHHALVQL